MDIIVIGAFNARAFELIETVSVKCLGGWIIYIFPEENIKTHKNRTCSISRLIELEEFGSISVLESFYMKCNGTIVLTETRAIQFFNDRYFK